MKTYHISYRHITGERQDDPITQLFDFYLRLGELIENEHVSNDSIVFHTEEVDTNGLKEVETVAISYEAGLREQEYLRFKGNRK